MLDFSNVMAMILAQVLKKIIVVFMILVLTSVAVSHIIRTGSSWRQVPPDKITLARAKAFLVQGISLYRIGIEVSVESRPLWKAHIGCL